MPADLDAAVNLSMLHFLQSRTGPIYRQLVADELTQAINKVIPRRPDTELPSTAEAAQLRTEGLVSLARLLTDDQVAELRAYFEKRPCLNGHTPDQSDRIPRLIGKGAEAFHYGCYTRHEAVAAPHLLELANRPEILAIAERYLGCVPTLYSLHAWWSFSGHGTAEYAQRYHRDFDDFRFCTLFLYLTDVGPRNGAHSFIRRSHRPEASEQILQMRAGRVRIGDRAATLPDLYSAFHSEQHDSMYEAVFDGFVETITGPAGFGFVADTSGLHKGLPLTEGRRLICSARYGLYRNVMAVNTGAPPLPQMDRVGRDERRVYIDRCLVCAPPKGG